jgi:hypothetical protein
MKKRFWINLACLGLAALTGCSFMHSQGYSSSLQDNWETQLNRDPNQWTEEFVGSTPPHEAFMPLLMMQEPTFSNIHIEGNFQVQIVGKQARDSVSAAGLNSAVATTAIDARVDAGTLYIRPTEHCPLLCQSPVVIRIGLNQLHNLDNRGWGNIEGRGIVSDDLIITSNSRSHILLKGRMSLTNVEETGSGSISIIGARTSFLDIRIFGSGTVNVSGNVGLNSITNYGGNINIIGAQSNALMIHTSGTGTTGIVGNVNLREVTALDNSRVFVDHVDSSLLNVHARDRSRVGLAGTAWNTNIDTTESSWFEGESFFSPSIFVKAGGNSHANVRPTQKLFAGATDNGNIYVFNYSNKITTTKVVTENGNIIFVGEGMPCLGDAPTLFPERGFKGE